MQILLIQKGYSESLRYPCLFLNHVFPHAAAQAQCSLPQSWMLTMHASVDIKAPWLVIALRSQTPFHPGKSSSVFSSAITSIDILLATVSEALEASFPSLLKPQMVPRRLASRAVGRLYVCIWACRPRGCNGRRHYFRRRELRDVAAARYLLNVVFSASCWGSWDPR